MSVTHTLSYRLNLDSLLVKDGNHAVRERVVGNLGDLEELVLVNGSRAVLVELHKALLEAEELGPGDCKGQYMVQGEVSVVRKSSKHAIELAATG